MVDITYVKYLTEIKLFHIMQKLAGVDACVSQFKINNEGHRYDICVSVGGKQFIFEYDGNRHYSDPNNVIKDEQYDKLAMDNLGVIVKRIPYWMQIRPDSIQWFFGDLIEEIKKKIPDLVIKCGTEYPHGFIDSKHFPSTFCSIGLIRFKKEIDLLPSDIRSSVLLSLEIKANNIGNRDAVFPQGWVSEDVSLKKCSIENCDKLAVNVNGFCRSHSVNEKRRHDKEIHGLVVRRNKARVNKRSDHCIYGGCEESVFARNLCSKHYSSERDDEGYRKPERKKWHCKYDSCDKQAWKKSFCKNHYDQLFGRDKPLQKMGRPRSATYADRKIPNCNVEGCTKQAYKQGMCYRHLNAIKP